VEQLKLYVIHIAAYLEHSSVISIMQHTHYMYFFMVIASLAMLFTTFVILNILRYGARTVSSRLILFINISILVDAIASLPDVYVDNKHLCVFMAFMKSYSELINIGVAFLMIVLAYNITFPKSRNSRFVLTNWMMLGLFSFPLFLIIPVATDCLGPYQHHWCSFVHTSQGNHWFLGVLSIDFTFIGLTLLVFLWFACQISRSMYASYKSLFKGAALYSLITIISWIPKVFTVSSLFPSEFSASEYMFISRITTYLTGIAYGIVFLKEKKSLRIFRCCGCCDCCGGNDVRYSDLGQAASGDFDHTEDGNSFYAESHQHLINDRFAFSTDTDSSFDVAEFNTHAANTTTINGTSPKDERALKIMKFQFK
jgi:hypothetical protein